MKASLLALTRDEHRYLDELFLLHQESLLERNPDLALKFLRLFSAMLDAHMAVEEGSFFPALEACRQQRWPASLYDQEHRKIEHLLQKCRQRIEQWRQEGGSRRGLIAVLDEQRALKNVLEHHEQREEMALLPELDGQLSTADKSRLIKQAVQAWKPLRDSHSSELEQLRQRLSD